VTITNVDKKDLTDAVDADTGFTFNVTTQGSDVGAEPTGAIWTAIPTTNKTQVDLSGETTAADVAAAFEVAFDGLTGFTAVITTDDSAADGTMTCTSASTGAVAAGQVKNADDSGAGSISVAETTPGVTSQVDVTANTLTSVAHGLITGVKGQASSTDTLPAGLATSTDYFVIKVDADTYKLATSLANAQAGTAIDITDVGTVGATHTFTPTALASASYTVQQSNDGVTYYDIGSATNITVTGGAIIDLGDLGQGYNEIAYRYGRISITLTAGSLDVTGTVVIKEEG